MIQDSAMMEKRYERFVVTVCETGIVLGLKNDEGLATSSSVHFDDENGEPLGIICFWAEKALAQSCIIEDWSDYKVTEISLSDFIENWCVGMENDGILVGTEFDQNMFGYEVDPLDLILDLIGELKRIKKPLTFKKFKDLADLEEQVKAVL